jgi:hypothetical protein
MRERDRATCSVPKYAVDLLPACETTVQSGQHRFSNMQDSAGLRRGMTNLRKWRADFPRGVDGRQVEQEFGRPERRPIVPQAN